ncbi:MAG TPA: phage holin family protein [Actinomycetes bacterium]|nr:phage holin family protein [Actinomycetes bacterium]
MRNKRGVGGQIMVVQKQTARVTGLRDRSVADLVRHLTRLVPQLVRAELTLAKAELAEKGKQAGVGAGLFGGSGLFAFFSLAALVAAAILGLSEVLPGWAAALIVAGALLVLAGLLALVGRSQVRRAIPPVPEQAVMNARLDVEAVKESARP